MSLVVRVIAPVGRDAAMVAAALTQAAIPSEVCPDLPAFLHHRTDDHVGPSTLR